MRSVRPGTISAAFADASANAPDSRTRDMLVSLATALHDFVIKTQLSNDEWRAGIAALARAGETSGDARNEFSLLSDMLGISSLVNMISAQESATPSSVLGPFHQRRAPKLPNGGDLWKGQPGEVLVMTGGVFDAATGEPVAGATLDLWQNADNGLYAAQDSQQRGRNYHGILRTDAQGRYAFTTTRPVPYTVPTDGVAGEMLRLLGREAWRPAHLHVIVEAKGYHQIVTELFPDDDPWLDRDAAFAVREELVIHFERCSDKGAMPDWLEARDRLPPEFLTGSMKFYIAPKTRTLERPT
ncbi:dioxygenase [Altererythrobacter sp. ZODW24]|uniref:dioxygenase family protein n=1 Tax=Altererythrobacter sp. ZODW24 TaxID=2185142 RepID=UPI0013B4784E|nr:dioxygenase [Altererythrobacter sp. ZODW24]